MPSSLVFAALVLAWLAVLVPVIARRRQMVPRPADADLSARVLMRTPVNEELAVTHEHRDHGPATGAPGRDTGASGATGHDTAVIERTRPDRGDEPGPELEAELEAELELDAYDGDEAHGPRRRADAGHDDGAGRFDDGDDMSDEPAAPDIDGGDDDPRDEAEAAASAPRGYRPGRGGFDPEAAAVAAQSRFAFRQRVALGLIAVALLSALAALVVSSTLWWLHLLADLVLVGYLVFLRRQTRLEEDLRARRAARLSGERCALEARRERQAAHDARMAAVRRDSMDDDLDGGDEYDSRYADEDDTAYHDVEYVDEYDDDDDDDEADQLPEPRRCSAPRTPAPPVPAGMELVADSPDDPAFHSLDGRERVPAYRRAAGA